MQLFSSRLPQAASEEPEEPVRHFSSQSAAAFGELTPLVGFK